MQGILKNGLCLGILGLGVLSTSILPVQLANAQATIEHIKTQRIELAPNATSIEVQNANTDSPTRYVLQAKAGQLLDVMVNSANPDVHLTITGANGTVLNSAQDHSSWRGFLPVTQDYYINITKPTGATYDLSVTIPEQIQFASGAISERLSNNLPPHASHTYIAKAKAGQIMSLSVNSPATTLTIYGVDGTVLTNGNMSGAHAWNGRLPHTESYIISVNNHSSSSVDYNMPITIR